MVSPMPTNSVCLCVQKKECVCVCACVCVCTFACVCIGKCVELREGHVAFIVVLLSYIAQGPR